MKPNVVACGVVFRCAEPEIGQPECPHGRIISLPFFRACGRLGRGVFLVAGLATFLSGIHVMTTAAEPAANPLLFPWAGPYGGVPPFDRAHVADFESALVRSYLRRPTSQPVIS